MQANNRNIWPNVDFRCAASSESLVWFQKGSLWWTMVSCQGYGRKRRGHNCCLALARTSQKVHTQLNVDTLPKLTTNVAMLSCPTNSVWGQGMFSYIINVPQTWRLMDLRSLLKASIISAAKSASKVTAKSCRRPKACWLRVWNFSEDLELQVTGYLDLRSG